MRWWLISSNTRTSCRHSLYKIPEYQSMDAIFFLKFEGKSFNIKSSYFYCFNQRVSLCWEYVKKNSDGRVYLSEASELIKVKIFYLYIIFHNQHWFLFSMSCLCGFLFLYFIGLMNEVVFCPDDHSLITLGCSQHGVTIFLPHYES